MVEEQKQKKEEKEEETTEEVDELLTDEDVAEILKVKTEKIPEKPVQSLLFCYV